VPVSKLALLALLPAAAHATCAIAVWTPESIILGADSKEIFLSPNQGQSFYYECKLRQIGPYYVLVAGVMHHRQSGFNVWEILAESVARTNSVPEAAEAASVEIGRRYGELLRSARQEASAEYLGRLKNNSPDFAIAGFSGGRPYVAHYEYDLVRGAWTWHKRIYGRSREPGSMDYTYLCDPNGIEAYKRRHPQWRTEDPLKTVAGMIASTARVDSSEVGGPTALLVVDANGPRWESTGTCR
jgi:hypothetical protein